MLIWRPLAETSWLDASDVPPTKMLRQADAR